MTHDGDVPGPLMRSAHEAEGDGAGSLKAACATVLGGEAAEWVQLLPAGTFQGVDGRGPYHVADPEAVVRQTRERAAGADLPIDYGHALEVEGPEGDGARAAGWITAMEVREGEIWGRVEWTERGAAAVQAREYRFLSPVFWHDRRGNVAWIQRAGLTNRPNLTMQSINSSTQQEDVVAKDKPTLLTRIRTALGLAEDADEDAVIACASAAATAEAGLAKVAQAAGLAKDAGADQVSAAVQAAGTPDPSQYVPRAQFDEVSKALQTAQKKEGERVVDQAIQDGKLIPAQRAWALSYHARDPKGFEDFIAMQPTVVEEGAEKRQRPPGTGGGGTLDEGDKAVCAALGLEEEKYAKNLHRES